MNQLGLGTSAPSSAALAQTITDNKSDIDDCFLSISLRSIVFFSLYIIQTQDNMESHSIF